MHDWCMRMCAMRATILCAVGMVVLDAVESAVPWCTFAPTMVDGMAQLWALCIRYRWHVPLFGGVSWHMLMLAQCHDACAAAGGGLVLGLGVGSLCVGLDLRILVV